MKYKEFMKITDRWSDNDRLIFLMDYPVYHEMIMRFILHNWRDSVPVEYEEIEWFANHHNIMEHTDLPEVEE
jgi:hypothetical protein|tara:strand:+ start:284 stop:499 length:216 start_codon:yes stop_codon:yes gene_type:complete